MAVPQRSPTVSDVLSRVGCPLVEVAADEPLESIARMLSFCGLDAVLLVRPCGKAERIVSTRGLVSSLASRRMATQLAPDLPRCQPDDPIFCAARTMFTHDHDALLVEQNGKRLAIVTIDSLARYLGIEAGAPE